MVTIVLASHGPMAEAMVKSSQMLFGESEHVKAVCLHVEDNTEDFAQTLKNAIEPDHEVLLLVDIPGGTPSNQGMHLLTEFKKLRVVSGMNLMMLLECLIRCEYASVDELAEIAVQSSKNSIQEMKLIRQDEAEDELDDLMN